jgi:hypothetical protein
MPVVGGPKHVELGDRDTPSRKCGLLLKLQRCSMLVASDDFIFRIF